jgi:hypothetical protein
MHKRKWKIVHLNLPSMLSHKNLYKIQIKIFITIIVIKKIIHAPKNIHKVKQHLSQFSTKCHNR